MGYDDPSLAMPVVVATEYFPFVLLDMGGAERTDEDLRRVFAELHAHP